IVGDGICWRNAELLSEAQKSWDLFEFARSEAFLHQNDRPANRVDHLRIYRGAVKYLPECLQIELNLLAIILPLASGLEFEKRERPGRGFNDAIDGSTDDAPVHPHREGHFVQRATRLVQDADILAGADRLIHLDSCIDGAVQIVEVVNFIAAHKVHCDIADWPPIPDPGSRIPDPPPLKQSMHKRSNKPGCGRPWFETASVGSRRHQGSDRDTRRRRVDQRLERCEEAGIRASGFGIRTRGNENLRIPDPGSRIPNDMKP